MSQPPWNPQMQPDPSQGQDQPPQPPRRSWPRRHKGLTVTGGIAGVIVLIGVISAIAGGGHGSASTASSTGPDPAAVSSAESAAAARSSAEAAVQSAIASPTPQTPTKVEFIVSGSAPDGIDITYGPSGSNFAGPTTLDGKAVMSVPFDPSASYYSVNAQLQGSGDITCKIVVTGPGDVPATVSHGAARGGYNVCDAQAAPTDSTGLNWQNEN